MRAYFTKRTTIYGPFSGTTRMCRCQKKKSSELYGAREYNRGRHTDNLAARYSIWTNQRPTSIIPPLLHWMPLPFLPQPSQFILAWDRHQICWLAYPVAWFTSQNQNSINVLLNIHSQTMCTHQLHIDREPKKTVHSKKLRL